MKQKIKYISIVFLLVFSLKISAQDLTNYSLNPVNNFLYNPASAGENPWITAFLNSHLQWVGFDGAPRVNTVGVHGPLTNNMGVGLSIVNNQHSIFNNLAARLSYSYKLRFEDDHFLSFGIAAGVLNDKATSGNAINYDSSDPLQTGINYSTIGFSASTGMFYKYNNLEGQLILPQLYERSSTNFHTITSVAYNFLDENNTWDVKPMFLVRAAPVSPAQFDINVTGTWQKTAWANVGYRSENSMVVGLGMYYKNMNLGYAVGLNLAPLSNASKSSHEIQLIYNFGEKLLSKVRNTAVTGNITNSFDGKPLAVPITFSIKEKVKEKGTSNEQGIYSATLKNNKSYTISVSAEGYVTKKEILTLMEGQESQTMDIVLDPKTSAVSGVISNIYTAQPIQATVKVMHGGKELYTMKSDAKTGVYKFDLPVNKNYTIEASAKHHITVSEKVDIALNDEAKTQNMSLKPTLFSFGIVKFKTGTTELSDVSYPTLDKMINFMNVNKEVRIEIGGHTDNTGDVAINDSLSQARATSCFDYLVKKGIAADRLKAVGYGSKKPIVSNNTAANRAKNRRVEFNAIRKD